MKALPDETMSLVEYEVRNKISAHPDTLQTKIAERKTHSSTPRNDQ
ncbi:hypothetical protein OHA27_36345 [Streptomyces sp. NBC_01619]|nr:MULTISPECIES: hypothetical protein [unclassified Streptomyces]MCX4515668.1 hypothetical protein [Streptomyces sp. NBC_01619]